jgi:hypothetical protein
MELLTNSDALAAVAEAEEVLGITARLPGGPGPKLFLIVYEGPLTPGQ